MEVQQRQSSILNNRLSRILQAGITYSHLRRVPHPALRSFFLQNGRLTLALFWLFNASCAPTTHFPTPDSGLGQTAAHLLSRAIQLKNTNPPGEEALLAKLYAQALRAEGIESRLIKTPPHGGRNRAAVWARLPGSGSKPPIILLSHLDTVEAGDVSAWRHPPFAGTIQDGYVNGRGALDAKGVGIVQLFALLQLAKRDQPLERDIIFLATPDEERGGIAGAGFVAMKHSELLGGAEFLLTEGGYISELPETNSPLWRVAISEKTPCWIQLRARGPAGHSATANPNASVSRLIAALEKVRTLETKIQLTPEVIKMFRALALSETPQRKHYRNLKQALRKNSHFRRWFLSDPGRNALVRNTVAITVLSGSQLTNVLPSEAFAHLDARLLPGESCQEFARQIEQRIADPMITLERLLSFSNRSSSIESTLFRAIEKVAKQDNPNAQVIPRITTGFTDAHYFREIGIEAYGFTPRWLDPGEIRGVHGVNERISIENLERGIQTLVRILEAVD